MREVWAAARVVVATLAGSALIGCTIGPDFRAPTAPVAEHFPAASDPAVDTTRQEYRDWWSVFADPTLDYLVATAYAQNLDLRMAGTRVLAARAQLGGAIGELYPQQQQLVGSTSYNRLPGSIPYNIIDNTYWQTYLGAQAAWEIDLWGKIRRGVESADMAYLSSVASYDDVLVTLLGDVAQAYVQIRTLQRRIVIAEENVVRQRDAVRIAQNRFHAGVVTKRDVYQAENVLGSTEAAIPALRIQLAQAENALAVLLGVPPGTLGDVLAPTGTIPVAPVQIAVGIPAELLRRRPDIRQAELDAASQCARIGVAKADLLPSFSLVGNVGTLSTDIGRGSLSDLFAAKRLTYGAGPTVQWNILNYGQITNNVRLQDARYQELLVGYQNTVLAAQQEVADAMTMFLESRRQETALRASTVAAAGALRIAMNEYTEGSADFTTVLTAEERLFSSQNDLAVAQGNVPLGLIGAYRALGGGWQMREGNDFVPPETQAEMAARTNWGTLLSPELLDPEAPGLPGPEDAGPTLRLPEW